MKKHKCKKSNERYLYNEINKLYYIICNKCGRFIRYEKHDIGFIKFK